MNDTTSDKPVAAGGQITIGGDLTVNRLGYGAMQITGQGVWGDPPDRDAAIATLRRAVELGVDFIDTADSYGPFVSEDLIREALHPYDHVTIATKGGFTRHGPGIWKIVGRPEYLRQCVLMSLRRLGLEQIPLWQLHRIDEQVPLAEQLGEIKAMQDEGLIKHFGLSEVSVADIEAAREHIEVVSVQNLFNLVTRQSEDVLEYCEREGIAFIPWFPIATGQLAEEGGPLAQIADSHDATPAQLALAWLLRRSPAMVPIPGTKSVGHVEENCAAATVELSGAEFERLSAVGAEAS